MLVAKWAGQVEEARWQSTYDMEDRVIFHGLELIQSYLEQFTSHCIKTVCLDLQQGGSEWRSRFRKLAYQYGNRMCRS